MNPIKEILKEKEIKRVLLSEQPGKSYSVVNSHAEIRPKRSIEERVDVARILDVDIKDPLVRTKGS